MKENGLMRQLRLMSKFMTSQTAKKNYNKRIAQYLKESK